MDSPSFFQCVDPGLRACGYAEFVNGELNWACLIENPETQQRGPIAHQAMGRQFNGFTIGDLFAPLYIEFPEVYPGMPKTDLNDLLEVAGVVGAVSYKFSHVTPFKPKTWKGNIAKATMTKRIWSALSSTEQTMCESKDHNILDAVGIGLYVLGRLNRKVIAYE